MAIQIIFDSLCQGKQENALFDRADTTNDSACFFIASHLKESNRPRALNLYKRLARSPQPFIAMSSKQIMNEMIASGR
jgi:hypothetical protein